MTALISKINPPRESKKGGVYQKIEMITQPDRTWCLHMYHQKTLIGNDGKK